MREHRTRRPGRGWRPPQAPASRTGTAAVRVVMTGAGCFSRARTAICPPTAVGLRCIIASGESAGVGFCFKKFPPTKRPRLESGRGLRWECPPDDPPRAPAPSTRPHAPAPAPLRPIARRGPAPAVTRCLYADYLCAGALWLGLQAAAGRPRAKEQPSGSRRHAWSHAEVCGSRDARRGARGCFVDMVVTHTRTHEHARTHAHIHTHARTHRAQGAGSADSGTRRVSLQAHPLDSRSVLAFCHLRTHAHAPPAQHTHTHMHTHTHLVSRPRTPT